MATAHVRTRRQRRTQLRPQTQTRVTLRWRISAWLTTVSTAQSAAQASEYRLHALASSHCWVSAAVKGGADDQLSPSECRELMWSHSVLTDMECRAFFYIAATLREIWFLIFITAASAPSNTCYIHDASVTVLSRTIIQLQPNSVHKVCWWEF